MKKLIATVLIALVAFVAFAAISVTIDTLTTWGGKTDPTYEIPLGFSIGGADETVFADMNATLSSGRASALLNIRFRIPDEKYLGAAVEVHGWDITAKIADWARLSVGNTAYELYAETISWEPIFGAGLFEQGKNRIYLDMRFGDLQLLTGMSMATDQKKPWKTLEVLAAYDVSYSMKLAFEFRMVPKELCLTMFNDGDVKTFSLQAEYFGKENMELVAGYSLITAKYDDGKTRMVQHRGDLFFSYFTEKVGIELYDALLLRTVEGEGIGNRLGGKFTWYAGEDVSPFVKFNWFKNYGYANTLGGFAWGECQIVGPGSDTSLMVLDAGIEFVATENVSGSLAMDFKFNGQEGAAIKNSWAIVLGLTAAY